MRRTSAANPYGTPPEVEARLLGILLAGALSHTRAECASPARERQELRPSGIQRIVLPLDVASPGKPPKPVA
jgi:hypothetical protein